MVTPTTIHPSFAFRSTMTELEDYVHAADFLNAGQFDVVSLQHEFGIFGGEAGEPHHGAALAADHADRHDACIRFWPSRHRRSAASSSGSSMSRRRSSSWPRKAGSCCARVYGVPADKIEVIPHGIPDFAVRRARRGEGQTRFQRQARHPDVRPALSEQGHRGHDRCHALDPEEPARCRVCRARRDASQSRPAIKARPIARASWRACARSASRTTSSFSTSSSIRRRCSTSSRCATSTSRPISTRRR